jgi:hypothetical protein
MAYGGNSDKVQEGLHAKRRADDYNAEKKACAGSCVPSCFQVKDDYYELAWQPMLQGLMRSSKRVEDC